MDGKLAGALDDGKIIIYSVSRAFEIVYQPVRHASPRTVRGPTDRVEGKAILTGQRKSRTFPSQPTASQILASSTFESHLLRREFFPWRPGESGQSIEQKGESLMVNYNYVRCDKSGLKQTSRLLSRETASTLIPPGSLVLLRVFHSSFLACRKLHYFMQAVMDTVRSNGSRLHARPDVLQLTAKDPACSFIHWGPQP